VESVVSGDTETATAVAQFMAERDLFARSLGIELLEVQPGRCRAQLALRSDLVNGLGMAHGAVIFSLADFAFATACNSYGRTAVALSMDIHFLASPKLDDHLIAEAVEVRSGRRTGLYRMTVVDEAETLIAELHGMAYLKDEHFLERLTEEPGNR
jgi:acyl-CoA thioesterase